MHPGDRLVCAFVKSLPVGFEFTEWPLHITIVPWFRTEQESAELAHQFSTALKGIKPLSVTLGEETRFGKRAVNLVEQPTALMEIERRIRATLHDLKAWLVDQTTKRRYNYRPHVTAQKSERGQTGDRFTVAQLSIVRQTGEHKIVDEEVPVG